MARLVSFSLVTVVPPPFKTAYAVGIAEDEKGIKVPVRIESEYFDSLKVGINGRIVRKATDYGELTYFIPEVERRVTRKVAIVTGGTRGIGKAIALELARRGYDVAINDVELPEEGEEAMKSIEAMDRTTLFVKADVSKYDEVKRMVSETLNKLGRIDVLVNNAGINIDRLLVNMSPEDWQRVIDVNLTGAFNCARATIPHMIEQGGGRIINISSLSALDGAVGQANYAASKGGIISLTKVIAREYAQYNILCNAIAPGCIRTRMTDAMPPGLLKERVFKIPLGRRGEPEEVAKLVAFLADEGSYITGQLININAGEYV